MLSVLIHSSERYADWLITRNSNDVLLRKGLILNASLIACASVRSGPTVRTGTVFALHTFYSKESKSHLSTLLSCTVQYITDRFITYPEYTITSKILAQTYLLLSTTTCNHYTPESYIRLTMAKRFINAPDDVVPELMQGLSLDSSRVTLVDRKTGHAIAVRSALASGEQSARISVVSGGGSGHEPMAAGYVGEGMLAGAVAGGVFASPSVPAIATLLDVLAPLSTGIVVIVMNYQGDRLNFRRAVDELVVRRPGYPITLIVVGDDVALPSSPEPRGIAGCVFVLKVAGAAADQGRPLNEVVNIAQAAAHSIASYGIALEPCTIPGHAVDPERLALNESKYCVSMVQSMPSLDNWKCMCSD